jgi:hypothetical protein
LGHALFHERNTNGKLSNCAAMFWHDSVEINSCPYLFFLEASVKAVTAEAMILSLMTGRDL